MRLYLIRHAHSAPGSPDELRPLTDEGRAQARELAGRLAALAERPDAVVTSPLLRARETATPIAKALEVELRVDDRLAPGATAALAVEAAAEAGERVVVVAHQPDCGEIAAALTGGEPAFPPAAVVEIDVA